MRQAGDSGDERKRWAYVEADIEYDAYRFGEYDHDRYSDYETLSSEILSVGGDYGFRSYGDKRGAQVPHGGSGTGYSHYGCRCELCTKANRDRVNRRRKERLAEPKDPDDPRHGKTSFYSNHGCRCDKCSEAWSARCKAYAASRKEAA